MRGNSVLFSIKLLRLAIGFFFIVLGIIGIINGGNQSIFALRAPSDTVNIIFSIVEIVSGVLILLGIFALSSVRAIYLGGFVVMILWITRIVLTKFIWCLTITDSAVKFNFLPNMNLWFLALAAELLIAASLLVVISRYE